MKILIADDSKTDMMMITGILNEYALRRAFDGADALEILERESDIDIMILDINMPKMTGFEVLEAIQKRPHLQKVAVLILTNYDEMENEIKGLELGAVDYIRKPLNMESLKKRIQIHVKLKNFSRELEENNSALEEIVRIRTEELVLTRDITIHALIGLLEVRDIESSNHTKRTQWMIKALCESLRRNSNYEEMLTPDYIKEIFETSPLHDIGKVGIPDSILLKPAKLTDEEFAVMKQHVNFGITALNVELKDHSVPEFIQTALDCISGHHEKFDGSGYPNGLKGQDIPLPGRLMAVVDVYDAIISKRVYKEAFSHQEALENIVAGKGNHFDPEIVDAFLDIEGTIQLISTLYNQQTKE